MRKIYSEEMLCEARYRLGTAYGPVFVNADRKVLPIGVFGTPSSH